MTLSNETREFVRRRAGDACEYCGLPQYASVLPHQIDHIIGRQHRGTDDAENLCLCCIQCNLSRTVAPFSPLTTLSEIGAAIAHAASYSIWPSVSRR